MLFCIKPEGKLKKLLETLLSEEGKAKANVAMLEITSKEDDIVRFGTAIHFTGTKYKIILEEK
jgi:hypothetical protein